MCYRFSVNKDVCVKVYQLKKKLTHNHKFFSDINIRHDQNWTPNWNNNSKPKLKTNTQTVFYVTHCQTQL